MTTELLKPNLHSNVILATRVVLHMIWLILLFLTEGEAIALKLLLIRKKLTLREEKRRSLV